MSDLSRECSSMLMSSAPICGRYEVRRILGKGGFGLVYMCKDLFNETFVAVKLIPALVVRSEAPRIVRELEVLLTLSLRHPNVMSVLDIFVERSESAVVGRPEEDRFSDKYRAGGTMGMSAAGSADEAHLHSLLRLSGNAGRSPSELEAEYAACLRRLQARLSPADSFDVYIVMPLMHGDLHRLMRSKGPPSSYIGAAGNPNAAHPNHAVGPVAGAMQTVALLKGPLAIPLSFQLCFAVDFLHKCNIVHRDIKPDNILVWCDLTTPLQSSILVADFGLARDQSVDSGTWYVCTRNYRPPELMLRCGMPDSSIDIWSVGCTLYEICTHQALFRLPTSRDQTNRWSQVKASEQLAAILNVVGTPSKADVEVYAARWTPRVLEYLRRLPPSPSRLVELIRANWVLDDTSHQAEWEDAIASCLQFFPQQRCTAEELCRHALFRDRGVLYGSNVKQYDPVVYTGSLATSTLTSDECRQSIIDIAVNHASKRSMWVMEIDEFERKRTPPLAPMEAESETPPRMALSLPEVSDARVNALLRSLPLTTVADVQRAIDVTLQQLLEYTNNSSTSAQLRAALRFFETLLELPKTEVVDGVAEEDEMIMFACDEDI